MKFAENMHPMLHGVHLNSMPVEELLKRRIKLTLYTLFSE
jgi:hypothetical protein